MARNDAPALALRAALREDAAALAAFVERVHPGAPPCGLAQLRGRINAFPAGQLLALHDGAIVGYAGSFRIDEAAAMADHDWAGITGGGYGARHDERGDWLYAMELVVDPGRRRQRIEKRLHDARQRLCRALGLKGVVTGAPMPGYARRRGDWPDPDGYLRAVAAGAARDGAVSGLVRAGFEPVRALRGHRPDDRDSAGCAALMAWRDPAYAKADDAPRRRDPETVRVMAVQFEAKPRESVEAFYAAVEGFVDTAADYGGDFVVFPELFTLQLLSTRPEPLAPDAAVEALTGFTEGFVARMRAMATRHAVNIVGGSHLTRTESGDVQNVAYLFLRDGSVHAQLKLHATPDERSVWNVRGGDALDVVDTDCGPVGVLICYDSEFPELARRLADQGARILFAPYCTDTRPGHLRVRYCCQARAVENQVYVVTAGDVGTLPGVENMEMHYAQSAVFAPCDHPFSRDGIVAEASENREMAIIADLNLATLAWARAQGAVRNLRDRRFDLYETRWRRD